MIHGPETIHKSDDSGRLIIVHCIYTESLILAQDERWRRVLGMQVERV